MPKQDSQVKRLLATREGFEAAFEHYFSRQRSDDINGSERTLYLMENKTQAQA